MIFKAVNHINTKADKAFFEELIGVYCKIVREVCNIHSLEYVPSPIEITEGITSELLSMGVICDKEQLDQLKKILKGVPSKTVLPFELYPKTERYYYKYLSDFLKYLLFNITICKSYLNV